MCRYVKNGKHYNSQWKIFTENPEIKLSKNIRFSIKIHNVMKIRTDNDYNYDIFWGAANQRGSWPPHSWGFLDYTQQRTTVGGNSLNDWSARSRDLYLTTHNTHNRQTPARPLGPAIISLQSPNTKNVYLNNIEQAPSPTVEALRYTAGRLTVVMAVRKTVPYITVIKLRQRNQ
jgi:hypothetical protein